MFVISQEEACDQDCNQMREQEGIINGDSSNIIDPTVVADKCPLLPCSTAVAANSKTITMMMLCELRLEAHSLMLVC